jgi:hypothetical protein
MGGLIAGLASEEMNDEEKLSRDISNEAYSGENERKNFGGFEYRAGDSDKRTAVYHNPKSKKTVIGYRGTADLKDAAFDTKILMGTQNKSDEFKRNLSHFDRMQAKYGNSISVSGHSKGGAAAAHVSRYRNAKANVFNTGKGLPSLSSVRDRVRCALPKPPPYCGRITRHRIANDPVSMLDKFNYGKHKTYDTAGLKSHSMLSFYR